MVREGGGERGTRFNVLLEGNYRCGHDGDTNIEKAREWYTKAAALGHATAALWSGRGA